MEAVKPLDAEEINRINFDISDRIMTEGVTLDYNPEADLLTITIGESKPAITEPLLDDVMYRVDPDTLKIVGVEIVAFFSDFVRRNKVVRKFLKGYLEMMREGKRDIIVTETKDRKILGEVLTSSFST
mgnify:CR=1 FL=1